MIQELYAWMALMQFFSRKLGISLNMIFMMLSYISLMMPSFTSLLTVLLPLFQKWKMLCLQKTACLLLVVQLSTN